MFLPLFGSQYINQRSKLAIALLISIILSFYLSISKLVLPSSLFHLFILSMKEIVIGIFLGLSVKTIVDFIHTTGLIIAYQAGLSMSLMFDPNSGTQGSVIGNYLLALLLTIMFLTDVHLLYIEMMVESYNIFPIGGALESKDMAISITSTVAKGFGVAIKMSLPYVLVGLIIHLVSGLMARLMPNMQVLFVLMPLQILVILFMLTIGMSELIRWFIQYHNDILSN